MADLSRINEELMKLKTVLTIFAALPVIVSFGSIGYPGGIGTTSRHEPSKAQVDSSKGCLAEDEVSDAIRKLSGQIEVDQARKKFLRAARRSPGCRQQVIAAITSAMDKPNLNITYNQTERDLWHEGSILLGNLKAVEALDLLIKHLDMDDGEWSRTMSHTPALEGVIRMGSIAIPKLSATLSHSPDRSIRQHAVFCLSFIGGRSALRVLRRALPSESDRCVHWFISESINGLDNKRFRFDGDSTKWFSAFVCIGGSVKSHSAKKFGEELVRKPFR